MSFLYEALIFLAAAALVVPLSKRFGFGAVLGYLVAGLIIGPSAIGLIDAVDETLHFAEIGVVFLLFVIGLELKPARLWVLRRSVFGLGSAQVMVTGALLSSVAIGMGLPWPTGLIVGFALSLSSTAFVIQLLAEKKELGTAHGRSSFGVLLFQDLAVIPLIALVPLLAGVGGSAATAQFDAFGFLLSVGYVVAFIFGARLMLRPLLRMVAAVQTHEIFTAAALLLVIGSALLMDLIGFSMGLGAFIAGVLMADSEYRHQLETDIEPFKGLLLGLFFMAVGMSTNLSLLATEPGLVILLAAGLITVKGVTLWILARLFGFRGNVPVAIGLILAQGGEFAFVLFTYAATEGLMGVGLVERLTLVVTISMAATPLLYAISHRLGARSSGLEERPYDAMEDEEPPVIIAGFGRFGQIIARVLNLRNIAFTAMDANVAHVDFVRRYGNRIYYADATRLDLLRTANAGKARAIVITVENVETSLKIAETVRHHFPDVTVYARAHDRQHSLKLMALGVHHIVRETLHSSLVMARDVLESTGLSADEASAATELFREHDADLLERQFAIRDDEDAMIQSAVESATELRRLFASDSEEDR